MSVFALLERGARRNDGRPFLISDQGQTSYPDALQLASGIARGLRARGFGRGDHAAILGPNDPNAFLASFGVMGAGLSYVPANPREAPAALARSLDRLDVRVLFFHSSLAPVLEEIRPALDKVRLFVSLDGEDDTPLAALIDSADRTDLPQQSLSDIAFIGQTGGTTGEPKGVLLSHRAVIAYVEKYLAEFPDPQPVMLAATPLTHAAGMLAMPVVAQGGTIVLMTQPHLPRFLDLIAQHKVTMTFLPPTVIYRLLDMPDVSARDYSSLRNFFYGAAPASVERIKQALTVFGPVMTQAYGQTECHTLITVMRPADHFTDGRTADDARLSACGRPTIGTSIAIKDDDGRILAQGGIGEICVHSDLMMSGYYRDQTATADVIREGFVHTGDVGFIDADGFLHIVDRKKDMVITGGFNVYPAEVEQVVASHPAVGECAVVGLPDPDWGEALTVVVELKHGAELTEADLIAFCRPRLGGVKTPKRVEFWTEIPRSAAGKVLRKEVRTRLQKQAS
ncbi:MAG: AMP-binding protein [Hyphomonadaceae bacterium]|nr:AMP-binding protein [Hyphomonadaceae bacterium]